MRSWLTTNFKGSKSSSEWIDLWNAATTVDYRLAQERTDEGVLRALATEDALEIPLRRLASHVYERRTGDSVGAMHMLAVTPPGVEYDVAPSWMVEAATEHSKAEQQRRQREQQERKAAGQHATAQYDGGGQGRGQGGEGGKRGGGGRRGRGRGGAQALQR